MNCDPLTDIKETPDSPATALANNVLPVPGGPSKRIPFGILAPILLNFYGSFKNSTTSCNSYFDSSQPATSLKDTLTITALIKS